MECFTVRDGLSGENARFHEASDVIYIHLAVLFKPMIVKMTFYQRLLAECIGQRRF